MTQEQDKNEHKMTIHENVRPFNCNKDNKKNKENENDILTVHEKETPRGCASQIKTPSKSVHEKSNKEELKELKNISLNAAKFVSIINKSLDESEKPTKESKKVRSIAGINLDQNRFSELLKLDGRFRDSNSNANVNANASTSVNANSKTFKDSKKSSPNLGPTYFLKISSKSNCKSNKQQRKNREDIRYDPKKDRQNVVFHKARKKVINLAVSTRPKIDDIQMVNMSLFFSPMPATPSTSPTATTTVSE